MLTALVGISAPSGAEDDVRGWLRDRLERLGLACVVDGAGNLIATVPGVGFGGPPLLLNAHMDRVPPGRGHTPVVQGGVMRSDGTTNLGADDAAGLTIVLLVVEWLLANDMPHPPLVLLFTTGEEVGLRGAAAFDPAPWGVREGLVFDNAGAAGALVTRGASYIAFDAVLRGHGGHPGKDLAGTLSAIEIFRRVELLLGSRDGDTARVSLGQISGGTARNAIPAEVRVAGEVRTLLEGAAQRRLLRDVAARFTQAATALGGTAEVTFEPHGAGYTVGADEPLPLAWRAAWEARGTPAAPITTFIGSDANALRRTLAVVTVSTGVVDEHTSAEAIALAPLATMIAATADLLLRYRPPGG
ncbi:MAG TPA: M20/M25/M40 family metallo-hydrolase [Ktedonobacterales bacterium]|nr:M20/M25/M40 family metallo-hydrolase [Ktedonobacterales bacterium]